MTNEELVKLLQKLSGGMICGKHVIELEQAASRIKAPCDMIAKYEKKPVDRKLLCAEQAIAEWVQTTDDIGQEWIGVRAIELYEEGFGK